MSQVRVQFWFLLRFAVLGAVLGLSAAACGGRGSSGSGRGGPAPGASTPRPAEYSVVSDCLSKNVQKSGSFADRVQSLTKAASRCRATKEHVTSWIKEGER